MLRTGLFGGYKNSRWQIPAPIAFTKIPDGSVPIVGNGSQRARVVCISDMHFGHNKLTIPPADILLIAGDILKVTSKEKETQSVNEWISKIQCKEKYFVCGNHDIFLMNNEKRIAKILSSVTYLKDSSFISPSTGVKIYGSPWTKERKNVVGRKSIAFSIPFKKLIKKWTLIPSDTDILITHCPPWGIFDLTHDVLRIGSLSLRNQVASRVFPKVHVFGHNHNYPGMVMGTFPNGNQCLFINASCTFVRKPIRFDLLYN